MANKALKSYKIGLVDADLLNGGTRHPNLVLLKIAGYLKDNEVEFDLIIEPNADIDGYDYIYMSKVFTFTPDPPLYVNAGSNRKKFRLGGTGTYATTKDVKEFVEKRKADMSSLENDRFLNRLRNYRSEEKTHGIDMAAQMPYYRLYDKYIDKKVAEGRKSSYYDDYRYYSIGFLTRGCFRHCPFCVNKLEGQVKPYSKLESFLDNEVDENGKITANGKEVTKILLDGKEFFSDDPKVASKNIPVEMVQKLQVVDRKSDLARITGVDDGEEETVINLTIKPGMKQGWFGEIQGGYGYRLMNNDNTSPHRYQGGAMVNYIKDDDQFTLILNSNNVNSTGFTDQGQGQFRRWGGNNGIATSHSLGVNFNVGNQEIFRVGGDVMYSHSDRDNRQRSDRQYLFTDSTSYAQSGKASRDKGHNVRASFRVQWNPDSMTNIVFRPGVSHSNSANSSVILLYIPLPCQSLP